MDGSPRFGLTQWFVVLTCNIALITSQSRYCSTNDEDADLGPFFFCGNEGLRRKKTKLFSVTTLKKTELVGPTTYAKQYRLAALLPPSRNDLQL